MAKINEALELIANYQERFRNKDLPKFEISELYTLLPQDGHEGLAWPSSFPYGDRAGVYFILDASKNILYIGKSSKSIGSRLSKYFGYSEDKISCFIKDPGWTSKPHFILTIAVPKEHPFEAASLEEYALFHIPTPDNYNLLKNR